MAKRPARKVSCGATQGKQGGLPGEEDRDQTGYVAFHICGLRPGSLSLENQEGALHQGAPGSLFVPSLPLPTFTLPFRLIPSRKSGACWGQAQGRGFSLLPAPGG